MKMGKRRGVVRDLRAGRREQEDSVTNAGATAGESNSVSGAGGGGGGEGGAHRCPELGGEEPWRQQSGFCGHVRKHPPSLL
jgi:hypothetical protein